MFVLLFGKELINQLIPLLSDEFYPAKTGHKGPQSDLSFLKTCRVSFLNFITL